METLLTDLSRIAAVLSSVQGLRSGHDGVVLHLRGQDGSCMEVVAEDDTFLAWRCNWQRTAGTDSRYWEIDICFAPTTPDTHLQQLAIAAIFCGCIRCRDLRLYPAWGAPESPCAGTAPEFSSLPCFRPCSADGRQI